MDNYGKLYKEHTSVLKHREWRGFKDTMYDYYRWLVTWKDMIKMVMKAPVTVFLIPGILSMVPGTSIYRVIYYMMHNDTDSTRYYLIETLQIAGMIVFARRAETARRR